MEQTWMKVDEVATMIGVSQSKAYAIIKDLNKELKAQGYITIAGRISRKFFNERFYGSEGIN